jgi:hypothetical protein
MKVKVGIITGNLRVITSEMVIVWSSFQSVAHGIVMVLANADVTRSIAGPIKMRTLNREIIGAIRRSAGPHMAKANMLPVITTVTAIGIGRAGARHFTKALIDPRCIFDTALRIATAGVSHKNGNVSKPYFKNGETCCHGPGPT